MKDVYTGKNLIPNPLRSLSGYMASWTLKILNKNLVTSTQAWQLGHSWILHQNNDIKYNQVHIKMVQWPINQVFDMAIPVLRHKHKMNWKERTRDLSILIGVVLIQPNECLREILDWCVRQRSLTPPSKHQLIEYLSVEWCSFLQYSSWDL